MIRLDSPPDDLQPATFADSATVVVGQPVMALGTPLGLENTVTTGIISAVDRPVTAGGEDPSGSDATYTSALQTDAAINPGNSGGPLIDAAGQVIGINSSIAGIASSTGQAGSIGLGFAIPSNTATMIAEQLKDSGSADHSFLGVTSSDGTETVGDVSYRGAQVRGVEGGSPAAEAGLREGDLITKVDDTPVGGAAALTGVVRGLPVDSSHTLTVVRDQDEQTLDVTLAGQPIRPAERRRGSRVEAPRVREMREVSTSPVRGVERRSARSIGRHLASVSACSETGSDAATRPPPACSVTVLSPCR